MRAKVVNKTMAEYVGPCVDATACALAVVHHLRDPQKKGFFSGPATKTFKVLIIDGFSFHYAHTWSKSGISIC